MTCFSQLADDLLRLIPFPAHFPLLSILSFVPDPNINSGPVFGVQVMTLKSLFY